MQVCVVSNCSETRLRGKGYGWQLEASEWQTPKVEEGKVVERKLTLVHVEPKTASGFDKKDIVQDFYELRDLHLKNGTLFEDPEFPCDNRSVKTGAACKWKRPHEFCRDPQFFAKYVSRFDVRQGQLENCWFVAALADLTLYKELFFQVVPKEQSFTENYAGIFHFRFWRNGYWKDVVVDDRLPTYFGQLIFLSSSANNVFWSALLEKAYAKMSGSYEALKNGFASEAMADFTGGVTEKFEVKNSPNLFDILLKVYQMGSMMGCAVETDVMEEETPEGLIGLHVYSITRVEYVNSSFGKIPLLRLRNPWGRREWNGPWSDNSQEWHLISKHEKEKLSLTFDNDGEFWMSYADFEKHFDTIEMCHLPPNSVEDKKVRKRWDVSCFEGEWVPGISAGGCGNFSGTFPFNPQYRITLTKVDEDDDSGKCTLIVSLLQKNKRSQGEVQYDLYLSIGFEIFHLFDPNSVPEPLDSNFFLRNRAVASVPSFTNLNEVSYRYKLLPGTYCIVPSTFYPNEHGEFLLRAFSLCP